MKYCNKSLHSPGSYLVVGQQRDDKQAGNCNRKDMGIMIWE